MATQVFRAETRPKLESALVRHIEGKNRPEYARTVDQPAVELALDHRGAQAAIDAYEAWRKKMGRRAGRRCHHVVDLLFAGPPGYGTEGEWDRETEGRWAADVVQWVRESFPASVVADAALHRDEASPHVHVLIVPVDERGVFGWTNLSEGARRKRNPAERRRKGGDYRALQDSLHESVSVRYGLARGEVGSKRKHQPVDKLKGAERAFEITQARTRQVIDEAADEAAKLAAGDEAIAASHGVTWTRKAKRGREERERLEGELREAKGEAKSAREREAKAVEKARQWEEHAQRLRAQLDSANERHRGIVEAANARAEQAERTLARERGEREARDAEWMRVLTLTNAERDRLQRELDAKDRGRGRRRTGGIEA